MKNKEIKKKTKKDFLSKGRACSSKRRGFTLLELMVVIGIIGIMTGVSLVSLSPTKNYYALKATQDEVTAAIKLAQSYALQGKEPSAGIVASAYGVKFNNDKEYEIFYCSKADSSCNSPIPIETQVLQNGVRLSSPTDLNDTKIYFGIPSANIMGAGTILEFDLAGDKKNITINSVGLVTEN